MKLRFGSQVFSPRQIEKFLEPIFEEDLHAKRLASLGNTILGAIRSASLGINAIGRGLAAVRGLDDKHAIKQVRRWLGNQAFDPYTLSAILAQHRLTGFSEVFINLDWTDFDHDDHTTLVAALQTKHGRAVPLLWKTYRKSELKDRRNGFEDELLRQLHAAVPSGLRVTIVADRGFADQKLYDFLKEELGFDYIIRLRGNILVTDKDGETRPAKDWVGRNGRLRLLRGAKVTGDGCAVGAVVCVQDKGMKEEWCLVTSRTDLTGNELKKRYGKRFTIEETFRDYKDLRYGMGLSWTKIKDAVKRDRLFLVATLASSLLTLLGEAGERAGLDKGLKPSTAKKRVYSLFRQGVMWYERIPMMKEERLKLLLSHFNTLLNEELGFALAA